MYNINKDFICKNGQQKFFLIMQIFQLISIKLRLGYFDKVITKYR